MGMRRGLLLTLVAVFALPTAARAQQQEKGAAIGGIGGALAGAAIGKNNGDTAAGALIGGALGLITGAAIGNSADERDRQAAYRNQQMYYYARAVSAADVVTMSQNGIGEDVIINHIRENGVQRRPDVSEVITLHRQGVSERVLTAMQTAPEGGPAPRIAPQPVYRARPVVVEEYYYVRPPVWGYPHHPHFHYHSHGHGHGHPRSSVHWGFSFGH